MFIRLIRRSLSIATGIVPFAWLLADQGIFAATNFVINILFARWLSPVDYGMFAVSFSGYLLLTVLHFGAILEPILVQSTKVEPTRTRSYIGVLIKAHALMIAGIFVLASIGFVVATWLGSNDAGWAVIGAMVGGSLMVTLLTARRLCLVFLSTRISALIGLLYATGVVITSYLIRCFAGVTWFDMWLVMGGWSLLCSVLIFGMLYAALNGSERYGLGELCRFQWQYARFGLAAAICSWFRVDGVLLMLAHLAGLEVIAETRAVLNIANPTIQVNLALYTSWLVMFSRDNSWKRLAQTATIYCLAALLAVAIAFIIATPLVQWTYNGRYLDGAWLLPLYCIVVALNGVESVFTCFLKAGRFLKRGYAPQIIGSALAILLGYLLIPMFNEAGALYAVISSFAVGSLLAFLLTLSR